MPTTNTYTKRREHVLEVLKERGISKAEVARRIGYETEGGTVYVRKVLGGFNTSEPLLARIEEELELEVAQ